MSTKTGAVIYTDGGYAHNMSLGGWGIHGYFYEDVPPKRGTGNPKAKPSADGYMDSSSKPTVNITEYLEGAGPCKAVDSSGNVELIALHKALEYINVRLANEPEFKLDKLNILLDNEYVVKAINTYIKNWRKNNWVGSKGTAVKYTHLWRDVDRIVKHLKDKGIKVDIKHIRGHNGDFGNETSDSLATLGLRIAKIGREYSYLKLYPAMGFWNARYQYNPMIDARRIYMSTTELPSTTDESLGGGYNDHHAYYLGEPSKLVKDAAWGKPCPDNAMSVIYIKDKDPVIDTLVNLARDMDQAKEGRVYIGRLDRILVPRNANVIDEHGVDLLWYYGDEDKFRRRDVTNMMDLFPLLVEQNPPGLAYKGVETLLNLQSILNTYINGLTDAYVVNNITDLIFEEDKKGVKLKSEITPQLKHLKIPLKFAAKGGDTLTKTITIRFATDLPTRNSMNKMKDYEPELIILTWRVSPQHYKYASILKTNQGIGIWAAVYSNDVVLEK